jgi:hypothetical protein
MSFNILLNPEESINLNNIFGNKNIIVTKFNIGDNSEISINLLDNFYNKKRKYIYILSNKSFVKSNELYIINNSLSKKHNICIHYTESYKTDN